MVWQLMGPALSIWYICCWQIGVSPLFYFSVQRYWMGFILHILTDIMRVWVTSHFENNCVFINNKSLAFMEIRMCTYINNIQFCDIHEATQFIVFIHTLIFISIMNKRNISVEKLNKTIFRKIYIVDTLSVNTAVEYNSWPSPLRALLSRYIRNFVKNVQARRL